MKSFDVCTLFHKSLDTKTRLDTWTSCVFRGVHWSAKRAVFVGRNGHNGLDAADVLTVRIYTDENIDAANGDRIYRGAVVGDAPPKGGYTITAVRDNRLFKPDRQRQKPRDILSGWKLEGK